MAEHHKITGALLNATHHAIAAHPHPARKAAFAKILAMLAGEQAKEHADGMAAGGYAGSTSDTGQGGYGGQIAEQLQGAATPMTALPHERVYQPLLPEDNGMIDGIPLGTASQGAGGGSLLAALLSARGGAQMPLPTGYPIPLQSRSATLADALGSPTLG